MKNTESNIEDIIIRFFDGSIVPSEKQELFNWIESSNENKKEFLRIYKTWNLSKAIIHDYNDEEAYFRFCETIGIDNKKNRPLVKRLYWAAGIAASIIIIALTIPILRNGAPAEPDILSFVNLSSRPDVDGTEARLILSDDSTILLNEKESLIKYGQSDIKVNNEDVISKDKTSRFNQLIIPYGKKSTITFSDGTKAWVNAGTRIVYPTEFNKKTREIYVDGEIYIDVAPDKNHPFIVRTNDLSITVLGTSFNVKAYESDNTKDITLVSGTVQVSMNGDKESVLSPNQQYTYNRQDGSNHINQVDASEYILWIKGLYLFKSEKLHNIAGYLSKYHGVEIKCDEQAANLRYSGKLDLNNELPVILKHITHSLPILFEEVNTKEYIIRMKK